MRQLLVLLSLTLVAACGGVKPAELAKTTSFDLARTRGRFETIHGLQTFAITMGKGRDIVLLHGNPASTYTWRKTIEPLAARYRVHVFDLPGFGFSDKPDEVSYDTPWLAGHVVGYLDAVGVQRAVLVGNSMGGHVATETAMLHPDRVAALVLLAASGLPTGDDGHAPLSLRMMRWPVLGPLLRSLPARGRVRNGLEMSVYDSNQITEEDVDAFYLPLRSQGGTNAFLARMGQAIPPDRPARVRTIAVPTLVITGDTDRLVPPEMARQYHELIPNSELLILERTGHMPQEERPERIVTEITRWVEKYQ